jgi:hypothetical protein
MVAENSRHEALADITRALLSNRSLPKFFEALSENFRELFPEADDFGIARYFADRQLFQVIIADVDDGHPITNMGVKTRDTEDTPAAF